MSTRATSSAENALSDFQSRVRESLERLENRAQAQYRAVARQAAARPFVSLTVAFFIGLAVARLLEKID